MSRDTRSRCPETRHHRHRHFGPDRLPSQAVSIRLIPLDPFRSVSDVGTAVVRGFAELTSALAAALLRGTRSTQTAREGPRWATDRRLEASCPHFAHRISRGLVAHGRCIRLSRGIWAAHVNSCTRMPWSRDGAAAPPRRRERDGAERGPPPRAALWPEGQNCPETSMGQFYDAKAPIGLGRLWISRPSVWITWVSRALGLS
jgi:hypothetical protein